MDLFFNEDDKLLKTCNVIWNKLRNGIKKELDCEPIYNIKFVKTKIRSYGHVATDFYGNIIPKVDSNYTCLAVILLYFVFKMMKSIILKCF